MPIVPQGAVGASLCPWTLPHNCRLQFAQTPAAKVPIVSERHALPRIRRCFPTRVLARRERAAVALAAPPAPCARRKPRRRPTRHFLCARHLAANCDLGGLERTPAGGRERRTAVAALRCPRPLPGRDSLVHSRRRGAAQGDAAVRASVRAGRPHRARRGWALRAAACGSPPAAQHVASLDLHAGRQRSHGRSPIRPNRMRT